MSKCELLNCVRGLSPSAAGRQCANHLLGANSMFSELE